MLNTIKSLVAKSWKNSKATLKHGTHYIDEEFVVRVQGSVEKLPDELAAPTVDSSVPLIPALALFWEKSGIARDSALAMLRDALQEAMQKGVKEDPNIQSRMEDIEAAMKAIRQELIADADVFIGKVIAVKDGDSIVVLRDKDQIEIRLLDIDCPELAQAFGRQAKKQTSDLCFGKTVTVIYSFQRRFR